MAARTARQFSVRAPAELADGELRRRGASPSQAFQRGAKQLIEKTKQGRDVRSIVDDDHLPLPRAGPERRAHVRRALDI